MRGIRLFFLCFFALTMLISKVLAGDFTIARVKYGGGGDWYSNPTSIGNLLGFIRVNTKIRTADEQAVVDAGSKEIFNYPVLYLNGHGRIQLSEREAENLREYLLAGGFLHCDDNYGLDKYIRSELKRVFSDEDLVELPFSHPIYHSHFDFPAGPPKIHEHDGLPAQGFGIIKDGRLMVYYTYQSDLGDGWEDPDVHDDPPEKRLSALRMGVNIVVYALSN